MHDSNQPPDPGDSIAPAEALPEPAAAVAPALESAGPSGPTRALLAWLVMLVLFGAGGLLFNEQELALLSAVSGIFVVAHAADISRTWRDLYAVLGWVLPALGFATSFAIGLTLWQSDLPGVTRALMLLISACAAGFAVLLMHAPIATRITRAVLRDPVPSHVTTLATRIVLLAFALAVPGWFAAQIVMEELVTSSESFMDRVGLWGGLIGYVLLAFAGVGWLVRRSLRSTVKRLGLAWPGWRELLLASLALAVLWGLNTGADALQQRFLPDQWASDRRVTEAIASGMGASQALVLGLSAGIGEEITLRGALQPRLGILLTSAFFAALHVQYSWFGMLVILSLGLVLGWTRRRTNTTVAILAHVAYDVIAVLQH